MVHSQALHEAFLEDTLTEVERQEEKWGVQTHPTGVGTTEYLRLENIHRNQTDENASRGLLTWADILLEEVYEALGATTPANVVNELIQCAAVCCSMARSIQENGL